MFWMRGFSITNVLIACFAVFACWRGFTRQSRGANSVGRTRDKDVERPKYYIPTKNIWHLSHVIQAFDRAGYDLVRNDNYTDDWHVMWSYHNPFYPREGEPDLPSLIKKLRPEQKVNHIPGASFFTSKVELAKASGKFDFVPKSFVVPQQYDEFLEFHESQPKGTTWVKKGAKHRGVEVVDPYDQDLKNKGQEVFVQQFVRPYLIDGHAWDMGIYVAVTSLNPLRAYYYDNILLRFCSLKFEEDLNKAHRDSYVVEDDYIPPWGVESLRKYYVWGLSSINVLRAYFSDQEGVDIDKLMDKALRSINELLVNFEPTLASSALRHPHGRKSFFSLYRVDFLIDRNFQPWLTEVNQSPNLSSLHTKDLSNMFERIALSLMSLMGFMPGGLHHPHTTERDLEVIAHSNEIDIAYDICSKCKQDCGSSPKCMLCRRCRSPSQSSMIREMISEHRNRQGFIRLYPQSSRLEPESGGARAQGKNNDLIREWIALKCRHDYTWC
ncbi:hypothetical protein BSKO_14114 [Bryopsis sp. KO-2023]|nr:hypothetical protein BSKO_14114 [Bryopsis sp. KO-2023]